MARQRRAPQKRAATKGSRVRTRYVAAAADDTQFNLRRISHIVVLMLENRSFDPCHGGTSAVAGRAAGSKDGRRVPIYDEPSFVRHLESHKVSWRWYSHDVGTLRFSDSEFYLGYLNRFAYFDRRSFLASRNFLDDAAAGTLPAVSWIDPNFVDVSFIGPSGSNDDHPPSDIKAGQELVLKVYSALVNSPNWGKTMLIVT